MAGFMVPRWARLLIFRGEVPGFIRGVKLGSPLPASGVAMFIHTQVSIPDVSISVWDVVPDLVTARDTASGNGFLRSWGLEKL
jgi:hypothetical protein